MDTDTNLFVPDPRIDGRRPAEEHELRMPEADCTRSDSGFRRPGKLVKL